MPNLILPETVYHGTLLSRLPNFREKIIDSTKWVVERNGNVQRRDFGFGLYTGIDFDRVARFIKSKLENNYRLHEEHPCILELEVLKTDEHGKAGWKRLLTRS